MIIKYNCDGIVEWAHAVGGTDSDVINSVAETSDGGYIVVGSFASSSIDLGNEINIVNKGTNPYWDGIVIKYNAEGDVEWAKGIGGDRSEFIRSVIETRDGGYLIGGSFYSKSIELENDITLTNKSSSNTDSTGMLVKYSESGEIEWAQEVGGTSSDSINSIAETSDGGYIVGGRIDSNIYLDNILIESGGSGKILKYNSNGELQWARGVGKEILTVVETSNGNYIVGGDFDSETLELENGTILTNKREAGISNYAPGGMIIEFENTELPNPRVQDVKQIGGTQEEKIQAITKTSDGGYIVGGFYRSNSIDLGDGIVLKGYTGLNATGILVKYNAKEKVEWAKIIRCKWKNRTNKFSNRDK